MSWRLPFLDLVLRYLQCNVIAPRQANLSFSLDPEVLDHLLICRGKRYKSTEGLKVKFACSYRGYGLSEGRPNQVGLLQDTQSALDYILKRDDVDPAQVY